jgi:adenylate cyclase
VTNEAINRKLTAILAADVVGYSRLMSRDEQGTLVDLFGHLDELIEPCILEYHGRIVKKMGDGLLVEFGSVIAAVECAMSIQDGMQDRNEKVSDDKRIEFRIGVNLGDVITHEGDVFGDGVNIASRLEGLAEGGGICISDMVYQGVRSNVKAAYEDIGLQQVKNIGDPIHAYLIRTSSNQFVQSAPVRVTLNLPEKPSIAVLPFDNISGDSDQEYFSDGITEDIITELTKISGIFVIARHSVFAFKGQSITLKEIGQTLGVRYVLEGSVRKSGNRLRITAQLIDAIHDHHLWADRFDRDLEDIFAVQEEVARSVATALVVKLKPDEQQRLSKPPTDNIESYDLYRRTRAALWPPTRENALTSRIAYQRIKKIDPDFPGGYAGESMTYSLGVIFGHSKSPQEDSTLAKDLAKIAEKKSNEFAMAYSSLGLACLTLSEFSDATCNVSRAVELQPSDADAHFFSAFIHMFADENTVAYEAVKTAIRLDPQYVNGPYMNILGIINFCGERYDEAIEALELNRERGGPIAWPAWTFRAAAYQALGRCDEAKSCIEELLKFEPDFKISRYAFFRLYQNAEITRRIERTLRDLGLPN